MYCKDVEERVRGDHQVLRAMLERIEQLAEGTLAGGRLPEGSLRAEGHLLLERLSTHMSWEDEFLIPVLAATEGWGDVYVARLQREHAEQRELLEYELTFLHHPARPNEVVARNLLDLASLLRADMTEEEHVFLPRVEILHPAVARPSHARSLL